MADYVIRVEASTEEAENKLRRVEKHTKAIDKNININVNTDAIDKAVSALGNLTKVTASTAKTALDLSRALNIGPGAVLNDIEDLFRRVTGAGEKTVGVFNALAQSTPTRILGTAFDAATGSALQFSKTVANIGYEIFGLTQSVTILQNAFGGFFNETIGREIRLQEALLRTKTTLISTADVLQNGKRIDDPVKALEALDGPINQTVDNIRRRSLEIAGTTSEAIVQTFGVVASQIGGLGGTLKDAENLAISFAGALGTIGMSDPMLATQEIRSIMTGNIDQNSVLARMLGITGPEIQKAKQSSEGLVAYLQKRLEGFTAGQKMAARGFAGIVSNIEEVKQEISRSFGKELLAPLLESLTTTYLSLVKIFDTLKEIGSNAGATVANVVNIFKAATANAPITQQFKLEPMAEGAREFTDSFKNTIAAELREIQPLITRIINEVLEGIARVTQGLGALVQGFAYFKFEELKVVATQFANIATILNNTLVPALQAMLNLYGQLLQLPIVNYFAQVGVAQEALEKLGVLSVVRLVATWKFYQESINTFIGWLKTAFQTMKSIFDGAIAGIAGAFEGLGTFIKTLGETIVTYAEIIANRIFVAFFSLAGKLGIAFIEIGAQLQVMLARINPVFGQIGVAIAGVGKSLLNLSRNIDKVQADFAELRVGVVEDLAAIDAKLKGVGTSVRTFGVTLGTKLGAGLKNLATGAFRLGKEFLKFQIYIMIFEKLSAVITDMVGRAQRAQERLKATKDVETALARVAKGYEEVGGAITEAGQKQKDLDEQLLKTNFDANLAKIDELSKKIKQLKEDQASTGVPSLGETSRFIFPDPQDFFGVIGDDLKAVWNVITSIPDAIRKMGESFEDSFFGRLIKELRDDFADLIKDVQWLYNFFQKLGKDKPSFADSLPANDWRRGLFGRVRQRTITRSENERQALVGQNNKIEPNIVKPIPGPDPQLAAKQRTAALKELKQLEQQIDNEIFQERQKAAAKEIEQVNKAGQLRIDKIREANLMAIKGGNEEADNFMKNFEDYLAEKEKRELNLESDRKKFQLEMVNIEQTIGNYRIALEEKLAAIRQRAAIPPEQAGGGGPIIAGAPLRGGAVVTQRNDPDGEQTGSDIVVPGGRGGAIQNPFDYFKVTKTGTQGGGQGDTGRGFGKYVVGEVKINGKTFEVMYAHLDQFVAEVGQVLRAGAVVGKQGISGHATGPHSSTHVNAKDGGDAPAVLRAVENALVNGTEIQSAAYGGTTTASAGSPNAQANVDGYLKRLAYLESELKNVPNREGSGAMGYFQTKDALHGEAARASGGLSSRSSNYEESAKSIEAWLKKYMPKAFEAIQKGQFNVADVILSKNYWPSLPGGPQAQNTEKQKIAARYLPGGDRAGNEPGLYDGPPDKTDANLKAREAELATLRRNTAQMGAQDIALTAERNKFEIEKIRRDLIESLTLKRPTEQLGRDKAQLDYQMESLANRPLGMTDPREIQLSESLVGQARAEFAKSAGVVADFNTNIKNTTKGIAELQKANKTNTTEYKTQVNRLQEYKQTLAEVIKATTTNANSLLAEGKERFALIGKLKQFELLQDITSSRSAILPNFQAQALTTNVDLAKLYNNPTDITGSRQIEAEAVIAAKLLQLDQLQVPLNEELITQLRALADETRVNAENMAKMDIAAQTFAKGVARAREAASTLTQGYKSFLGSIIMGGNPIEALNNMLEGVASRFLDMALDYAFEPVQKIFEDIFKDGLKLEDPKEALQQQNTEKLAALTVSNDTKVVPALDNLAATLNKFSTDFAALIQQLTGSAPATSTTPPLLPSTPPPPPLPPNTQALSVEPFKGTPTPTPPTLASVGTPSPIPTTLPAGTPTSPVSVSVVNGALPAQAPITGALPQAAPALPSITGALDLSTLFPALDPTLFTTFETGLGDAAANLTTWTTGLTTAQTGLGDLGLSTNALSQTLNTTTGAAQQAPGFFSRLGPAIQGATGALASVAVGIAGAQQMSKGGTYNTLMGLAGIFSGIAGVAGAFSPMGGLGGLFKAKGGPVSANRPYIVGEQGPELFMPSSDGEIVPNNRMDAAFEDTRRSLGESRKRQRNASSRTAMDQMTQPQGPISVAYESRVINNVEYVTTEQMQKATAQAAERGRALAYQGMQNSVRVRRRLSL